MSVGNITRFTEATRVQMPGLVHLTRLGYTYYGKLYEDLAAKKYEPKNNVYHCTAGFTCKRGQNEFRPDITIFVNGLPLLLMKR